MLVINQPNKSKMEHVKEIHTWNTHWEHPSMTPTDTETHTHITITHITVGGKRMQTGRSVSQRKRFGRPRSTWLPPHRANPSSSSLSLHLMPSNTQGFLTRFPYFWEASAVQPLPGKVGYKNSRLPFPWHQRGFAELWKQKPTSSGRTGLCQKGASGTR